MAELIGPLIGFLFLVGIIGFGILRMRSAEQGAPESIAAQKTAGLPAATPLEIVGSGLHQASIGASKDETTKHAHKGIERSAFLKGFTKGVPQGRLFFMNKGLVFLSQGPARLTLGKAFEIAFDKVVGGVAPMGGAVGGALGGLATGLVTALADHKENKDFINELEQYVKRPESFFIPYSEIIEVRYVKSSFVDRSVHLRRQTPDGQIEEYWVKPADHFYPKLIMGLRLVSERQALLEQLLKEKAGSAELLSEMIAAGRQRYPKGATPEQIGALSKEFMDTINARLKAKGTSLLALYEEANLRVQAPFANVMHLLTA